MTVISNINNPFAAFDSLVYGENFIGRDSSVNRVHTRLFNPYVAGSLSIQGVPRIGKSSLAYHTLIWPKDELHKQHFLPVWIDVGPFKPGNPTAIFREMVRLAVEAYHEACERIPEAVNAEIEEVYKEFWRVDSEVKWDEAKNLMQSFFRRLRKLNWRVIIVLDEFDYAKEIFKDCGWAFQTMRILAENEYGIAFVTISRRRIEEIEVSCSGGSVLHAKMDECILSMFDEREIEDLVARLQKTSIPLTPEIRQHAYGMCGGHPFLLNRFCYEVVLQQTQDADALDAVCSWEGVGNKFSQYYKDMTNILEESRSLEKLIEIVFGPRLTVTEDDISRFCSFGILRVEEKIVDGKSIKIYHPFTEHFRSYLWMKERDIDIWPLWCQTEREVRLLITKVLSRKYGEDWAVHLATASKPRIMRIVERLKELQQKDKDQFGGRASSNLLDYTYPFDLFEIMDSERNEFFPVLNADRSEWEKGFRKINHVRGPLAHSRDFILEQQEVEKCERFCEEVRAAIEANRAVLI